MPIQITLTSVEDDVGRVSCLNPLGPNQLFGGLKIKRRIAFSSRVTTSQLDLSRSGYILLFFFQSGQLAMPGPRAGVVEGLSPDAARPGPPRAEPI